MTAATACPGMAWLGWALACLLAEGAVLGTLRLHAVRAAVGERDLDAGLGSATGSRRVVAPWRHAGSDGLGNLSLIKLLTECLPEDRGSGL